MPSSPQSAWRGLLALTLLAALVRLAGLGFESYWFDEIWAVKQSRAPLDAVLQSLGTEDVHPPLWPLLLHVWIAWFGEGEIAVRSLSALLGAVAVPLFGAALGRLEGPRVAALGAALLAVHPYAVEFSQEARAYALLLSLSAGLLYVTVRMDAPTDAREAASAARRAAWPAVWAALATLLLYTHVFGALVDLALGALLLARRRWMVVPAGAAALALYAPWVPTQLAQIGRVQEGFWIAPLTWTDPVRWLWHWSGYSVVVLLLTVPLVVLGVRATGAPLRRIAAAFTLCLVVLPGLVSLVAEPFFQPKYAITMLLVLVGAAAVTAAKVPRLAAVGTSALAIFTALSVHVHRGKEQYRELADVARADHRAGRALLTEPGMAPYVSYYLSEVPLGTVIPDAPTELTLLLVHPSGPSALERALAARCAATGEVALVLARAARFSCR